MTFRPVAARAVAPASPLALFDETARRPGSIAELWRPQGDLLRAYASGFVDRPDVAFDLPTGTGKTMVGLLVGGWRRLEFETPVVYACPTQQLAYQVQAAADREQIQAVTLVGPNDKWAPADLAAYDSASAIAITTYSGIFNVSPKFGVPGTVLFDDAHAAEQYVAEAWTVDITRRHPSYADVVQALRGGLDGTYVQRILDTDPDIATKRDVRMLVPSRVTNMSARLDEAIARLPRDVKDSTDRGLRAMVRDTWWRSQMVRKGLSSCLVYLSWNKISIRPFVPPTNECVPFVQAEQRVYLSATLGHAGELNRAFGRAQIDRVPLPEQTRAPRSGRRYFVFSDLTDADALEVAQSAATAARKTLVLAPSTAEAVTAAGSINAAGYEVFTKEDIKTGTKAFAEAPTGVLALAGRYDGIDLPGEACRMVLLRGLPELPHLQEQFLANNLRARAALEERTRTRVVQGAGRATRSPNDHAIVMVQGSDLMRYLTRRNVVSSLDVDLQAEISFGEENSKGASLAEIEENVKVFLEQGDAWHHGAEPYIRDQRAQLVRRANEGESHLAASAPHEVEACQRAWRGDYAGAREAAQAAALALSGSERLRTYRSFWLYLAAVWSFAASDANAQRTGNGLLMQAHQAAKGTTWLRETDPGEVTLDLLADDTPAISRITDVIQRGTKRNKLDAAFDTIDAGLAAVEHQKSEPALTELGTRLGADAAKPKQQGRADSVWCWGERIWLALEAKTEHNPDQPLSLADVRQANTQLTLTAEDRGVPVPDLSADVILSPRTTVHPDAAAAADERVYLAHPDTMRELARDARAAWNELLLRCAGHEGDDLKDLVRQVFSEHRCLPSQVLQRLTNDPVKG